jgi:hypothetical protein
MKNVEKKRLAKIRKEFAELKGAGCIPVLMPFDEYLKMFDLDNDPNFVDSAGFSIADRWDDDEPGSHHCDDLDCNCSI